MKMIDILESVDEFTVTPLNNRVYITLNAVAPHTYDIKTIKELPHARINLNFKWNKGTTDEQIVPTLEWVQTNGQQYGKGLGRKLVQSILTYMKQNNVSLLAFDNFAEQFWDVMKVENPHLVIIPKRFQKRIGFLINPQLGKKPTLPF